MAVKITYRKGYPTKKCIRALLDENNIHGVLAMDGYDQTHSIHWGQWGSSTSINDTMLSFVDKLTALGIKVSSFKEAHSPTTGNMKFEKKIDK